jgi:hypothetical protein
MALAPLACACTAFKAASRSDSLEPVGHLVFCLLCGRWCRSRGASSASSPDCKRFSPKPVQSAFSDFQLIELVAQLCPFCIDPHEPLGDPLLLLCDLVQYGHQQLSP